ncbi:MAG: D-alanyl-D-alanine carboxypeptidase [Lentisphaerae bacterium]|nr:D-alanyl-D-alanine carboxypeptidase [Lentisphaerota bacterium]
MKKCTRRIMAAAGLLAAFLTAAPTAFAQGGRAPIDQRVGSPYLGAIVIDADTGMILFEDQSDIPGYPASVLKLMDLLIILDQVEAGRLRLTDQVNVTAEAARMGGSQVYLKENEAFTVDELLYALTVQSANDAALALAIHVAGSRNNFEALMNAYARNLGMRSSEFHSVHGLPPAAGQRPDISTARDLSRLARAFILRHPGALRYTSTTERTFRENPPFIMRTHNNLLKDFEGCDGLKTGYFRLAGYTIIATAKRGDTRLIAVVLGSPDKQTRDRKTAELLSQGFLKAPKKTPPQPTTATNVMPAHPAENTPAASDATRPVWPTALLILALLILGGALIIFKNRPRNPMSP